MSVLMRLNLVGGNWKGGLVGGFGFGFGNGRGGCEDWYLARGLKYIVGTYV